MRPTVRFMAAGAALALALALSACGGDDDDDTTATSDTTVNAATTTEPAAPDETSTSLATEAGEEEDVTVALGETTLGDTLVDGAGMTLYIFEADTDGVSTCNEGCASAWPAVTADGDPVIGDGLDDALFATITRDDGTTQVAVDGHPLYRFSGDEAAGDTNGQGVADVWYAAGPGGEKLGGDDAEGAGITTGGDGY